MCSLTAIECAPFQVICVNKMDLPEARAAWPKLREELRKEARHGRVDRICAATNTNLIPIMVKVCKKKIMYIKKQLCTYSYILLTNESEMCIERRVMDVHVCVCVCVCVVCVCGFAWIASAPLPRLFYYSDRPLLLLR